MTGLMSRVQPEAAYRRPAPPPGVLKLDGNEGALPPRALLETLAGLDPELLRRYPDVSVLEAALAVQFGVSPDRVIVTAGADDAIDRVCRAFLAPGRTMLLPDPTFEMLNRYAALAGGELVPVSWRREPFPVDDFVGRLDARTSVIAVVSPNNPTGAVASLSDVRRLAGAAPAALVLLDHVYVEYASADLTAGVLDLPNVLVVRTLSKAWGLAGCRVGYALGGARVVATLRAAGGPYPVAAPSLSLALARLAGGEASLRPHVAAVRAERRVLTRRALALGLEAWPSQANFVLVECGRRAAFLATALAALGVLVRDFPGRPGLETALRITLPGQPDEFARLLAALDTALAPDALLLDLDGVLADVTDSQTAAIVATARSFGVAVTPDEVAAERRAGDAANDWAVTQRLVARRGVSAALAAVTACYQALYLGADGAPALRERERLIPERGVLERLAARHPLAIVTGRPRLEAEWFLTRAGIAHLFPVIVCMEDAPGKPDAAPVRLALSRLGVQSAWLVGDTPDDARSAAAAGALPLGVVAPGDDPGVTAAALEAVGAARVLGSVADLLELLP
jgi:histidinol-phosphate aminotransferase